MCDFRIKQGFTIWQKWTCIHCGSRQTMAEPEPALPLGHLPGVRQDQHHRPLRLHDGEGRHRPGHRRGADLVTRDEVFAWLREQKGVDFITTIAHGR